MKGLIKRIIKESEFDWVDDIDPFTTDGDWVIEFENSQEYVDIQRWLHSEGLTWGEDEGEDIFDDDGDFGFFFSTNHSRENWAGDFDAYTYHSWQNYNNLEKKINRHFPNFQRVTWNHIKSSIIN